MVDIPIELFMGFIGASIAMAIFGFIRTPQIPAMMAFAGMFILVICVTTTNIILGYEEITTQAEIQEVLISNTTVYHYNVEVSNTNLITNNGTGQQWGRSEGLRSSTPPFSILVGDKLQCIDLYLAKVGSPTSPDVPENVNVGIWTISGNDPIQTYGSMRAEDLTTTLTFYTFCVEEGSERILQSGDRVGFQYRAGNSSNYVLARSMDVTGGVTFDGINTVRVNSPRGSGFTVGVDTGDITMRMYDFELEYAIIEDFDTTVEPNLYEFTELPKTMFALLGVIFILAGALMVYKE